MNPRYGIGAERDSAADIAGEPATAVGAACWSVGVKDGPVKASVERKGRVELAGDSESDGRICALILGLHEKQVN